MKKLFYRLYTWQLTCVLFMIVGLDIFGQVRFPGCVPSHSISSPNLYVDVPAPETASLGKYGDTPISYFTGQPNISIPIYDFSVRGVTIPVSLDYIASGVQVNSLPGWAGQNWTLNIGGVIIRKKQFEYDEFVAPRQQQVIKFHNYFDCPSKLSELLKSKDSNYRELKDELDRPQYDLSPDIYIFNFLGRTGRFFLDSNGDWRVESDYNLEVLFDYKDQTNFISPLFAKYPDKMASDKNQSKTIAGFKIRDENGNVYQFGYHRNAIEYTTNFWHMGGDEDIETWHAVGWYLTKITDKYGNVLFTLNYERGAYVIQIFNSYFSDYVREKARGILPASDEYSLDNIRFPYTFSISSPVYLNEINGANGIRLFIQSNNVTDSLATEKIYKSIYHDFGNSDLLYNMLASMVWKKDKITNAFYYLQSDDDSLSQFRYKPLTENKLDILRYTRMRVIKYITIRSQLNGQTQYKGFRFKFSYINNRMRLDSIMIQDEAMHYSSTEGLNGIYRFKYNDFDQLPKDYLTTAVDHWGYYNGKPYSLRNLKKIDKMNFTKWREPNYNYTKLGSLSEIQYPTGGTSVIEYEPNDYGQKLSYDRQTMINTHGIGGGLRVRSITEYDSPNHAKILRKREYGYNIPGTTISSGELFATPIYYWPDWKIKCEHSNATYHLETFHTSSVIPLANSSGISLGYTDVTENITELVNEERITKKTIYRYSNLSDPEVRDQKFYLTFGDPNNITPYDEYSELSFKRGRLLGVTTFDENNTKIRSTGYKYRNDDYLANNYLYSSNFSYECQGGSAQYAHYLGGVYKLYYPKYDVIEKSDTIFNGNELGQMITINSYQRSDHEYSSGYPYRHRVKMRMLESENIKRGDSNESQVYLYGSFNDRSNDSILYKSMAVLSPLTTEYHRNGKFVFKTTTQYKQVTLNKRICLVPSKQIATNSYGKKDILVTYIDYSATGIPLSYQEKGKPTTFLKWGMADCCLLMKSLSYIPFSISDAEMRSNATYFTRILNYIKTARDGSIGYEYGPFFNIMRIIKPNGYYNTYKYDRFGRLTTVSDNDNKPIYSFEYNYRK